MLIVKLSNLYNYKNVGFLPEPFSSSDLLDTVCVSRKYKQKLCLYTFGKGLRNIKKPILKQKLPGATQQSTSEFGNSAPQLFEPHLRSPTHCASVSQSPSPTAQG